MISRRSSSITDTLVAKQLAQGLEPIGLDAKFPGLTNLFREGDGDADRLRQPVDFYSPDTFNYVVLDISRDGRTLSVDTWGIPSYMENTFPELAAAGAASAYSRVSDRRPTGQVREN